MNRSNFEHAIYALVIQTVIGLLTDNWWAGAAAGTFIFIGREHAQRELKVGTRNPLKPWRDFDIWRWSIDSQLDVLFPIIATTALALMVTL